MSPPHEVALARFEAGAPERASAPAWAAARDLARPGRRALLKVCGIREPGELARLEALGVDLLGVRVRANVGLLRTGGGRGPEPASRAARRRGDAAADDDSLERALWIAGAASPTTRLVAVTVDSRFEELAHLVASLRPAAIQLHGFDLPACAARLKAAFPEVAVLEVLHLAGGRCLEEDLLARYVASGVDAFLLDSFASREQPGSTGRPIDLDLVERIVPRLGGVPFLIAGGCHAGRIPTIRARTGAVGIDVDTSARSGGRLDEHGIRGMLAACRMPLAVTPAPRRVRATTARAELSRHRGSLAAGRSEPEAAAGTGRGRTRHAANARSVPPSVVVAP